MTSDVELAGTDKSNYLLVSLSASKTANISLHDAVPFFTADGKTYDGTRAASITGCSLEAQSANHGVVSPDSVRSEERRGGFDTAAAGTGKTVTADVALAGTDKANYQLVSLSASTTANIDKRNVTASITADGKTYDGTRAASITGCSLEAQSANHGVVSPDSVGCSASNGLFDTAAAGTAKTLAADVALAGTDKANYQLVSLSASTTANIDKRNVAASITADG